MRQLSLLALFLASCGGGQRTEINGGFPLIPVLVPNGGAGDRVGALADGVVERDGWYCSDRLPPQRYEMMFADGAPRAVQAVGFVPGNIGPDGVGPVELRVQMGHGVAAAGQTFRATVRGRSRQLVVLALPHTVLGDHVVLSFMRRSPYSTATCLAEVLVFPDTATGLAQGGAVVRTQRIADEDAGAPPGDLGAGLDAGGDEGAGGPDAAASDDGEDAAMGDADAGATG